MAAAAAAAQPWMELTVKCTYVYSNFARVFIDDRLGFFFSILKEEEETRVATCNFDLIKIKHFDYKAPKSDEAHEEPILINCNKPPTINIQHVEIEEEEEEKVCRSSIISCCTCGREGGAEWGARARSLFFLF